MWPFKKRPVSEDKSGLYYKVQIVILTIIGLIPFFTFVEFAQFFTWLSMDGESKILFLQIYNEDYLPSSFSEKIQLYRDSFLTALPSLLLAFFLYRQFYFKNGGVANFVNPKIVRKHFFRAIGKEIRTNWIRHDTWFPLSLVVLFVVCAFIYSDVFVRFYYAAWGLIDLFLGGWLNDIYESNGINFKFFLPPSWAFIDVFLRLILPLLMLWVYAGFICTWIIFSEARVIRRLALSSAPKARFGGISSYLSNDFTNLMKANKNSFVSSRRFGIENPIYLGTTTAQSDLRFGRRHFGLDTTSHMLTVAQTGAGKSRDVLHNNIPLWPHGMFILDPKGEHVKRTYAMRKAAGFPVYVLDPYGLCNEITGVSDGLNLLDDIDINSPSAADDIMALTYAFIPPDTSDSGASKHFRETAQTLLGGLIAHVISKYPAEERNLCTVMDIFMTGKADGTLLNQKGFFEVLGKMAGNPVCGGLPIIGVKMLLEVKEGERGSIYSTFMRSVSWTKRPSMRNILQTSTFSINDIKAKNATVYVVVPFSYMKTQAIWIRSLLALAFKRCEFPRGETGNQTSLFILDEFLQLEHCKAVKDAFITLRGAGIKFWMLVQGMKDMNEYYPNADTMISACDKQFFGTDSVEDSEYVSKFLGDFQQIMRADAAGNVSREIVNLMDPAAVRETLQQPDDNEAGEGYQIVKPVRGLPLILNTDPCYWNIKKSRFGHYDKNRIEEYEEFEEVNESDFLTPEEVIEQLTGVKAKTGSSRPFERGKKSPLREDIDNLKVEIEALKNGGENPNKEKQNNSYADSEYYPYLLAVANLNRATLKATSTNHGLLDELKNIWEEFKRTNPEDWELIFGEEKAEKKAEESDVLDDFINDIANEHIKSMQDFLSDLKWND